MNIQQTFRAVTGSQVIDFCQGLTPPGQPLIQLLALLQGALHMNKQVYVAARAGCAGVGAADQVDTFHTVTFKIQAVSDLLGHIIAPAPKSVVSHLFSRAGGYMGL